jgi:hypothetical protein
MPQIEQKVCRATPVLNRYVVSTSLPLSNSKRSGGTIRCKNPFLLQIEQLHSVTCDRSAVTRKHTRPQWQLPDIVSGIEVTSFLQQFCSVEPYTLLVLRARLAAGPQLRSEIEVEAETLDIPEGSLLVAADELGVRTRRGEWWLAG